MALFANFAREIATAQRVMGTLAWTRPAARENGETVADDLEAAMDRHAGRVAFRFEGQSVSYGELEARANRFAHWALAQGLKPGDTVALFLENEPDFVAFWFGMAKVGVATALINAHLMGEGLAHCIRASGARHIVFGAGLVERIASARALIALESTLWSLGERHPGARDLGALLAALPATRPPREHRAGLTSAALALLIYTSGTTGLPKAARMSHMRVRHIMRSFIATTGAGPQDRVYVTLPLYHTTGGLCGVGVGLLTGATIVLRRRFSATRFWEDAVREGATLFVYIGELCRYLVNQPPGPLDRAHAIRLGFGNGLRAQVWEAFQTRFGVDRLVEFYGATEGNVGLINFDGKIGACGRIPPWAKPAMRHARILRFDAGTGAPLRGPDGRCIEAKPGEVGELVGQIGTQARTRFEGYDSPEDTSRKVLRDVFEAGDAWFRTGDLMHRDAEGYFYFVDRVGDTFRWKGENVSTGEVEAVLATFPGIAVANVFGVSLPGMEGRAGMAAITPAGPVDFDALAGYLDRHLPAYAQPLFLRVCPQADTTPTLKLHKTALAEEGFNPDRVADPLWFRHPGRRGYEPLTPDAYDTLMAGGYRF